MRYQEFERIVSEERMRRYVEACGGDTRKAMTLYRYNIELSQTMFAIICQFEVALRNSIDRILSNRLGEEWLMESIKPGGIFDTPATRLDFNNVDKINTLRNRIAHHEPICFFLQDSIIYTEHIMAAYQRMNKLFDWMGIDTQAYLFGIDHVQRVCRKIEQLKAEKTKPTGLTDVRGTVGINTAKVAIFLIRAKETNKKLTKYNRNDITTTRYERTTDNDTKQDILYP